MEISRSQLRDIHIKLGKLYNHSVLPGFMGKISICIVISPDHLATKEGAKTEGEEGRRDREKRVLP